MDEILEEEGGKRLEDLWVQPTPHIIMSHEKCVGKCNFVATCTAGCGCRWTTNSAAYHQNVRSHEAVEGYDRRSWSGSRQHRRSQSLFRPQGRSQGARGRGRKAQAVSAP